MYEINDPAFFQALAGRTIGHIEWEAYRCVITMSGSATIAIEHRLSIADTYLDIGGALDETASHDIHRLVGQRILSLAVEGTALRLILSDGIELVIYGDNEIYEAYAVDIEGFNIIV